MRTIKIDEYVFDVQPWNYGEKQKAVRETTIFKEKKGSPGELEAEVDPWALNDRMVLICVKSWNLKDPETGEPLPIDKESLDKVSPPEIIEKLIEKLQELTGIKQEEKKKS